MIRAMIQERRKPQDPVVVLATLQGQAARTVYTVHASVLPSMLTLAKKGFKQLIPRFGTATLAH